MNKRKKALLLSSIASLCILCGCSKTETIEIEGTTYIKNGEEYQKIDISDRRFEPGQHIIHYVDIPIRKTSAIPDSELNQGFNNGAFYVDIVPEGYKLVSVTTFSNNDGYDYVIVYILVNEKPVIAKGSYDTEINEIVYETPGTVVEETCLNLEP